MANTNTASTTRNSNSRYFAITQKAANRCKVPVADIRKAYRPHADFHQIQDHQLMAACIWARDHYHRHPIAVPAEKEGTVAENA